MPREREVSGPRLSAVELMITGAMAGVAGKSITAPLDRVKILYQVRHPATAQASGGTAVIARALFKVADG
jgi:hypothetical protein